MRKVLLTVATVAALFVPAASASAHDPILFVHGYSENGSLWNTMISKFQADGWTAAELNTWTYNTSQSNATTAQQVATKVSQIRAATGAARVDLITHSMGGLSTRYYTKNLGGASYVDDWVSLGGPNHGTTTAWACSWNEVSCQEMLPGSAFLNALNSGTETPGAPSVHYGTWWSPCDEIINPHESVLLNGATNTQTACLSHVALTTDATVYGQVRDFVRP
jgi:triacylglycerol lipase